jgi:hypothetical protein
MQWSVYEIFSVLSGLSLIVLAFTPLSGEPTRLSKDRVSGFVGGVAFIGYGWYTGHQTSGTFFFPIWIFVIPFGAVGVVVVSAISRSGKGLAKANAGAVTSGVSSLQVPHGAVPPTGTGLSAATPVATQDELDPGWQTPSTARFCGHCGAPRQAGGSYCGVCGRQHS